MRSVASLDRTGSEVAPSSTEPPCLEPVAAPVPSCSTTSSSCEPRKIDMIAGGASFAPRRWSWPASAMLARIRSACSLTARMTAIRKARNWALACGSLPGSSRFSSSSVAIDQLLCLPEPLIPANGFSWIEEHQAVLRREPPHQAHDDHVVVGPDRGRLVDRRHLELGRGDLVVARLGRDAEPPQLAVEIHHERQDPLADRAEVLVLELLALGRRGAEQGPAGQQQVGPLLGQPAVDQEVLLLGPDVGEHALGASCCRTSAGRGAPACRAPPASAAAGSCGRAPRR